MRTLSYFAAIGAPLVGLGLQSAALAIDSGNPTSVVAGGPWFVGRVQQATAPPKSHNGTGSYLGNNIVLTCAHVTNELVQPGAASVLQMRYQDFQLDAYGAQYAGLGVMDPNYKIAGVVTGNYDLGLIITLNMPQAPPVGTADAFPGLPGNPVTGIPGVTFPPLPPPPNPPVADATHYPRLFSTGYSSSVPNASAERTGGFTENTSPTPKTFGSNLAPAAPTPAPTAPYAAYAQHGDSGGPWWTPYVYVDKDGNNAATTEIFGVSSYVNAANTLSVAAGVTADFPFINGNGVLAPDGSTVRQIDRYNLPGVPVAGHALIVDNFDTGGHWLAGSPPLIIPKPGFGEIAVLNPLSGYDADTQVDVTDSTAELDGLVNNVNILVTGSAAALAALNVSYGSAKFTGGSGVLNGGVITVDEFGTFTSAFKFDNEAFGILKVQDGGKIVIGYSNPNTVGDTVVHNGPGCQIRDGPSGTFNESHRMDNQGGTIDVSFSTMKCGELLPETASYLVDQYSTDQVVPKLDVAQPIVVDNGLNAVASVFTVEYGSSLVCNNATSSTRFFNEKMGTFAISGDQPATTTTAALDSLDNFGITSLSDNARLTTARYTRNRVGATMTVAGGADGPAVLRSGPLVNRGNFTISSGGTVTASGTALPPVADLNTPLPTQPFLNDTTGVFKVNSGGTFALSALGVATNNGAMTFSNSWGYLGLMTNTSALNINGGSVVVGISLTNQATGTVALKTVAGVSPIAFFGSVVNKGKWSVDPAQTVTQGDFAIPSSGTITGSGQIIVGGNWLNQSTDNVNFDMKQVDLKFIDPATLNTPDPSQTTPSSIYNPSPTYTGQNLSRLFSPAIDLTSPGADPRAPVLYVGALSLIAGAGDNPSVLRTLGVDGVSVTTPDETTLDVRGGTIYDAGPFSLPPGTEIIDSLNPGRSLSSMVQFVSVLPDNDFAVQSLTLDGANYVALELPEPTAAGLLAVVAVFFIFRRSGQPSAGIGNGR